MEKGVPHTITITLGSGVSTDYGAVWVDWNADGDYNDAEETITPINGSPGAGP